MKILWVMFIVPCRRTQQSFDTLRSMSSNCLKCVLLMSKKMKLIESLQMVKQVNSIVSIENGTFNVYTHFTKKHKYYNMDI